MTTDTLKTGRSAGDRTFGGGLVIAGAGSAGSVIARRLIGAGDMCTCLNRTADRNDNDCQPIQPRQRSTTTSEQITESALAAVQSAPDPRIRQITVALVHHLHDLAREVRLQPDELLAAADFPKGCGEISDAARHEFILLSDVLGLTMVVDTLGPDLPAGALETSVLGPFYRAAPRSNPTATIFPMATTTNRHTSSAGSLIRPAGRSPVPNSMSGVPTTTGSTKTSIPTNPTSTCAGASAPTPTAATSCGRSNRSVTRSPKTTRSATCCARPPEDPTHRQPLRTHRRATRTLLGWEAVVWS
jgi:hypothetical protein